MIHMNMKRKIVLLPLFLITLLVSCTTEEKAPEKDFGFVGTKWEATYHFILNNPKSALVSAVYDFSTPTEVTLSYTIKEGTIEPEDMQELKTQKFSYTYTKPTLKILSQDKGGNTIYKVDEKAGTMSIVGEEKLDENGKWVPGEDNDDTILRLKDIIFRLKK